MTEQGKTLAPLCRRAYACRETHSYCRPAFPIDGKNFYFVGEGDVKCPYMKKYGTLYTCDCPVRQEIFQRYKI